MKSKLLKLATVLSLGVVIGCSNQPDPSYHNHNPLLSDGESILNVYSSRHFETDEVLFAQFTEETGIVVNSIHAPSGDFVERLRIEGENTPADLIIAADGGILSHAKAQGFLQPVQSEKLHNNVPPNLRDEDNYWHAMSYRARVIAYSQDRVDPNDITTYQDLTMPQWEDAILLRPSTNLYNISLLASLIDIYGDDEAISWANGVYNNRARSPQGNDRDQIRDIAAGVGDLTLINTYYLGLLLNSTNQEEVRIGEGIGIIFPNQETTGTHINISGMAIPKYSSNPEGALKLMEFITDIESQNFITNNNYEFPVNPNATLNPLLESWGEFKTQQINFSALSDNNIRAVEILNIVGWE